MRILQVTPYDFSIPSGVNNIIKSITLELSNLGHDVHVLAPSSKKIDHPSINFFPIKARIIKIPFNGSISKIVISPFVFFQVKTILKKFKPDIVHVHNPFVPLLTTAVLYYSKAVNIGSFHSYRDSMKIYGLAKPFLRLIFNRLDGKIAVSNAAKRLHNKYFPQDYTIISNGVSFDIFNIEKAKAFPEYQDGKYNILFIGRSDKRKGFDYLLKAMPLIKENIFNVRLLVSGPFDSNKINKYRAYAQKHSLDIKFLGCLSDSDLARLYASCDIFCAPSTGGESFGLILLEAMAMKKPIIASNIDGYNEVVHDGIQGILVPPADSKFLAKAIVKLLYDPSLQTRMGKEGYKKANLYTYDKIAKRMQQYYYSFF